MILDEIATMMERSQLSVREIAKKAHTDKSKVGRMALGVPFILDLDAIFILQAMGYEISLTEKVSHEKDNESPTL